jgi:endonuclease G
MQLTALDLERWRPDMAPPAAAAIARAPLRGPLAGAPVAARFRFLTADGQSATPLEQEALLGTNDMVEASFLDRCQLVAGCVGRLRFAGPRGRSYATGFLIAPGLVMTNHHVFPAEDAVRDASIEFGYRHDIAGQLPPTTGFGLVPGEFYVADGELDFAVVAVSRRSAGGGDIEGHGYLRLNPDSGKAEEKEFVTIIQHPEGEPLQIALRENEVIRARQDEAVIWYRADTAHGSSGAPVFNDSFQVAALHASGRIKRNERGEYALRRGGWTSSLDGLSESDVLWEANVGFRVSQICARLLPLAQARSAAHRRTLEGAMAGGDVLAAAVARIKARPAGPEKQDGDGEMSAKSGAQESPRSSGGTEVVVPLQLRISLEVAGTAATAARPAEAAAAAAGLEAEAFRMQVPVIYDRLEERKGFDRSFLQLPGGAAAPMPALTPLGGAVVAPLLDGSGPELKYHKFSVWMHKDRRLALFTASNVDWRARRRTIDGKKLTRDSLAGFPPNERIAEQWVSDARLAAAHQLPDVFYSEDRGAFDKGHLVRRDDVCWGTSFEDIQMGNGDTFHVTNCSPQTKAFNQGPEGEDNWGDLESHVQRATKQDHEKVIIYAGPIFDPADRWFRGKDDGGSVRVQIPGRYWKIVVAAGAGGPQAYGFVLQQDVRAITEEEFFVTEEWIGRMKRIAEIEAALRGWLSLDQLKPIDAYDAVHA